MTPLKLFISHSRQDAVCAREIYDGLKAEGFDPWLDVESIPGGGEWKLLVAQAVRESHVVLVLLSQRSVTRDGFLQREIHMALEMWQEKAPGRIYLLPVRLDDCRKHERLAHLNWIDLFGNGGWARLVSQLRAMSDLANAVSG